MFAQCKEDGSWLFAMEIEREFLVFGDICHPNENTPILKHNSHVLK